MARPKLLACLFVAFLAFSACAEDEPSVPEAQETADASPTAEASPAAGDEDATVAVSDHPDHGEILVDAEGMTLYLFKNDTAGKSTCTGQCAQTWPALEVDGEPTAGEGVDEAKLGTTDDNQVTYNDQPLYHFSPDEEPGDTKGQGINDVWYVVTPAGEAMEEK